MGLQRGVAPGGLEDVGRHAGGFCDGPVGDFQYDFTLGAGPGVKRVEARIDVGATDGVALAGAVGMGVAKVARQVVAGADDERKIVAALQELKATLAGFVIEPEDGGGGLLPGELSRQKIRVHLSMFGADGVHVGLLGQQIISMHRNINCRAGIDCGDGGGGFITHIQIGRQVDFLKGAVGSDQLTGERLRAVLASEDRARVAGEPAIVMMINRVT